MEMEKERKKEREKEKKKKETGQTPQVVYMQLRTENLPPLTFIEPWSSSL